jgi:putative transposase
MLLGIKLKATPTDKQKESLSQWMGCANFIWNAKCGEEKYHTTFARKYSPLGTYAPVDQKAAQFKSKELSPWLYDCPSQIIRNSAVNWYQTYQKFMKGECGKPKFKPKSDRGSIHLTSEVFNFECCSDGVTRLFIGTKTNNIGYLSFKSHRHFSEPKSIYIKKERGLYSVSFCYDDGFDERQLLDDKAHLKYLQGEAKESLTTKTVGLDRGVAVPVHAGYKAFDFTKEQKQSTTKSQRYIKRLQRRLSKQIKGSNRINKTKQGIAKHHAKCANIRKDFCHKTSHELVNSGFQVFVFEDLKTASMTKKAKAKQNQNGTFISNNAAQKSGLNKAILANGWHLLESYIKYKAKREAKAVFKVNAAYTSQECANCGHTHSANRRSQSEFVCVSCDHSDNADKNASNVIAKRAINLILDSGTELSKRGVLRLGNGRGSKRKTCKHSEQAATNETSKKISQVAKAA